MTARPPLDVFLGAGSFMELLGEGRVCSGIAGSVHERWIRVKTTAPQN